MTQRKLGIEHWIGYKTVKQPNLYSNRLIQVPLSRHPFFKLGDLFPAYNYFFCGLRCHFYQ